MFICHPCSGACIIEDAYLWVLIVDVKLNNGRSCFLISWNVLAAIIFFFVEILWRMRSMGLRRRHMRGVVEALRVGYFLEEAGSQ